MWIEIAGMARFRVQTVAQFRIDNSGPSVIYTLDHNCVSYGISNKRV